MKFGQITLCVCMLLQNGYAVGYDDVELELVQVVFRHGERTPQIGEAKLISGGNDSQLQEPWGFAQLTNEGKRQEFKLGEMLRRRYDDFLGAAYHPHDVYARSSGFDRTKTSLQLVLAALYPPTDELTWNEKLKWLPIPINAAPRELDPLFYLYLCPEFVKLYNELMNSEEMKSKLEQFQDLFDFLHEKYPSIDFGLVQLFEMDGLLQIQQKLNVPMPDWYTPELHERLHEGTKLYFDSMSYTPSLIRLNGGGMTRRLVENLDVDGSRGNKRKIYLYSGHEFTLHALTRTHGIRLDKQPAVGSAIILEKWRNGEGKLYVKMYEWTGPSEELVPLKLNDSEEYCSIEDYLNIVKPSLATDNDILSLFKNRTPSDLQRLLDADTQSIPL